MTTNNNNYSVKELVAKYRNYVFENAPKKYTEEKIKKLGIKLTSSIKYSLKKPLIREDEEPDYQLIFTLYLTIAGISLKESTYYSDKCLYKYAKCFYKDALTKEEFDFLCNHLSDTIIETYTNGKNWRGDPLLFYSDILYTAKINKELVKEYLQPKDGSSIYYSDAACDMAELYPTCNTKIDLFGGYEVDSESEYLKIYLLAKIWLYSKNINAKLSFRNLSYDWLEATPSGILLEHPVGSIDSNEKFNYIVRGSNDVDSCLWDFTSYYEHLLPNGRLLFFTTYEEMAKKDDVFTKFRETLVKDKAIASIVAFPNPSRKNDHKRGLMLVIEKSKHENVVIKSLKNNQTKCISYEMLNSELLWPSYYLTSLPSTGKPLSNIVSVAQFSPMTTYWDEFVSGKYDYEVYNIFDERGYPNEWENIYEIKIKNLVKSFKDSKLVKTNLDYLDKYYFTNQNGLPLYHDKCIFMFGLDDLRIGYFSSTPQEGIALDVSFNPIVCLTPKEGIDIRYVVALLLSPEVKSQILSICNGEVSCRTLPFVLDKIIIPDHDEIERLRFLAEANFDAMLASQEELKKNNEDYKKGVRMRKHAISQSMSSIVSMFNALNAYRKCQRGSISNDDRISRIKEITVNDAFKFMEDSFRDLMPAIDHLADVEYSFGCAEDFDPEKFIDSYISLHNTGWTNFIVIKDMTNDHGESLKPVKRHIEKEDKYLIPMMHFPKKALNRIFNNIISNAQSHGFTDSTRTDYQIRISWRYDGMNMIIEIANNGLPLPADRAVSTLFEYGVSTALHKDSHNGIGCHEIDDIMRRFDGSVTLISTPDEEFTVKYVLTIPSNMVPIEDMTIVGHKKQSLTKK